MIHQQALEDVTGSAPTAQGASPTPCTSPDLYTTPTSTGPRRGYRESDRRDFSPKALLELRRAAQELGFLLDRGYPRDSAASFVGNRYQFSARQRLALTRSVCGEVVRARREQRRVPMDALASKNVLVDGFNEIISLEVALCGSPVLLAQDGSVRDLAGLSGTYRPICHTQEAVRLLLESFARAGARSVTVLLDAPVSNSGRLARIVQEVGTSLAVGVSADVQAVPGTPGVETPHNQVFTKNKASPTLSVKLVGNADRTLADCARTNEEIVASNDSHVIDSCERWTSPDMGIIESLESCWAIRLA